MRGGSSRRARAGPDFITAHDGFTLRNLVSYDGKHNEASTGQWRRNRPWKRASLAACLPF